MDPNVLTTGAEVFYRIDTVIGDGKKLDTIKAGKITGVIDTPGGSQWFIIDSHVRRQARFIYQTHERCKDALLRELNEKKTRLDKRLTHAQNL